MTGKGLTSLWAYAVGGRGVLKVEGLLRYYFKAFLILRRQFGSLKMGEFSDFHMYNSYLNYCFFLYSARTVISSSISA